jgi:hypothetical protein
MEDLTSKVLNLLESEGIRKAEIRDTLIRIIEEADNRTWEITNTSLQLLHNLKDTIWYNLEHIPSGGEVKGKDDLRFFGTKYSQFMNTANHEPYVAPDDVESLLNELEEIQSKWSEDWSLVQLIVKSDEPLRIGPDSPSPVIIYDPQKESPTKYGYKAYKQNYGIVDSAGNFIESKEPETVLCAIEMKLGTYGRAALMRSQVTKLIEVAKRALNSKKGIAFDFDSYDYK